MIRRAFAATASLLLAVALVATAATGPVIAAKKDKQKDPAPPAPIESIKGKSYRMVRTTVAPRVTRIIDGSSDQLRRDGSLASGAPKWSDIAVVYVADSKATGKLIEKIGDNYPPGVPRSFYGNAADWGSKDPLVFVAVQMAKKLPGGIGGQQVEVGLDGDAATPLQAGATHATLAGVERFSLSGLFSNGSWATGTTDVSGRQPGDPLPYYNTDSGLFGYYDAKKATWYLIMPRPRDARSVTVSVRSSTGDGEVVDRLELPGGGHFVSLGDPTGGFKAKGTRLLLTCRSLETLSADSGAGELDDPDGSLIRYTAGVDASADPQLAAKTLRTAAEAMGPVDVVLSPVEPDAEPLTVPADLAVSPLGNAISLTFEAPAGQWRFKLADELELKTPAGESIIDLTSLTGRAGVLTGPGLDGFVAGDLSCAQAAEQAAAAEEDAAGTAEPTESAESTGSAEPAEEASAVTDEASAAPEVETDA